MIAKIDATAQLLMRFAVPQIVAVFYCGVD
jgi:hypothetical protein